MSDYPKIAARFGRDTRGHRMTVLLDQGLYRHLRFMDPRPGYSFYWFELITFPNTLVFRGDGDSFVFSRMSDMFQFFRGSTWGMRRGGREINPQYWAEKLETDRDSVMTYSKKLFDEEVAADLKAAEPIYPGVTAAWDEHANGFFSEYNTEHESEAHRVLDDFEFNTRYKAGCSVCDEASEPHTDCLDTIRWGARHRQENGEGHSAIIERLSFHFTDTSEWQLRDYDWWYLWACHAIVWGIARYDRTRHYGLKRLAAPAPAREAVAA